jgi:SPP1 family predicted phage head-tail adaptor
MSIGEMKHRITLQKLTTHISENGFETEGYQNIKTVWAKVSNLKGKEYFEAAAIQKEKTVKFTFRAGVEIDESMRILFQGRCYNIAFIDNILYENKYIEVKAMEVDENGQNVT